MSWLYLKKIVYVIREQVKRLANVFIDHPSVGDENKPVNFRQLDYSIEKIKSDVEYSANIGSSYLYLMRENGIDVKNKTILEIGPGINFGSILFLACFGANVAVVDRFLAPWEEKYHCEFYKLFQIWIENNFPEADTSPITIIRSNNGYSPDVIKRYQTPLEDLQGIEDNSIDIIFSNAVLEHLFHPEQSFSELSRVSKPGALGYHQVDFRDHFDFSKPLEFLLIGDDEYKEEMVLNHCERGNRYRSIEYSDLFKKNMFQLIKFEPNIFASDDYLDNFMVKVKDSDNTSHIRYDREELKIVSGYFIVQKVASK